MNPNLTYKPLTLDTLAVELQDVQSSQISMLIILNDKQLKKIIKIMSVLMEKDTQEIKNNHKLFKNQITRNHQKVTFTDLKPQTFYEIKIEALFDDDSKVSTKKMAFTLASSFMDSVKISENQNFGINNTRQAQNDNHFLKSKQYGSFYNHNTV